MHSVDSLLKAGPKLPSKATHSHKENEQASVTDKEKAKEAAKPIQSKACFDSMIQ
jgi:hypothetical protein